MSRARKALGETGSSRREEAEKNVCVNRKARHDYFILSSVEAGIALVGSEVKSIREGKISLRDAYATIEQGQAYILNMHISPYEKSSHFSPEPLRTRRLLLHKSEIRRLTGKVAERGLTLIPLRVYLVRGKVKIELALARGKLKRDRRQQIAKRDAQREMRKERAGRR
jgi:SsrA-binding protein